MCLCIIFMNTDFWFCVSRRKVKIVPVMKTALEAETQFPQLIVVLMMIRSIFFLLMTHCLCSYKRLWVRFSLVHHSVLDSEQNKEKWLDLAKQSTGIGGSFKNSRLLRCPSTSGGPWKPRKCQVRIIVCVIACCSASSLLTSCTWGLSRAQKAEQGWAQDWRHDLKLLSCCGYTSPIAENVCICWERHVLSRTQQSANTSGRYCVPTSVIT